MRTLRRASAGYLRRHPWQLALALLGIATGVAVIVAVDIANSSAQRAFRLSMEAVTGQSTHQVIGGPAGIDERLYTRLRVADGFRGIAPVIEGYADTGGQTLRVLGVDLFAESEFRNYAALRAAGDGQLRRLLSEPGAVLLAPDTAAQLSLAPGDRFQVTVNGRSRGALLVGLFDKANAGSGNLLLADIASAQDWLGMQGRLTRIDVRADRLPSLSDFSAALPPAVQLLSAAGRTQAVAEMSKAFAVNLQAMSLLALLVGVFLVYNSVSFAVLQRRDLLATLRALGLTAAQAVALVIGEAFALGVAGSVLGLAAGIWLGDGLLTLVSQSINDLYFRVTVTELAIAPLTLAKGIGAGLLATTGAAAMPAIEAAHCPPRLAMTRISIEQRVGRLLPRLAIAGLLLAAASLPLLLLTRESLVAGLVALFLAVFGFALAIPWCVRRLSRALAGPAGRRAAGITGRIAIGGIAAGLSRTGVAIVALAVAVSATAGVSTMVGSFRLAVSDWLDNSLRADLYVSPVRGSLAPEDAARLARVPGIAEYSSSRRIWVEGPAGRTRLVVLELADAARDGIRLLDAGAEDAWTAFERSGAVLVSESWAWRHEAGAGDTLLLRTDRGQRAFAIAAAYRSYDANAEAITMSRRVYDTFWDDSRIDGLGLYLSGDAEPLAVRAALQAASGDGQAIEIRSSRDLRELSMAIFDRTFIITDVLYWLATAVPIVGVLAAMLALQMERSREFATLRALGLTRAQLGRLVCLQSAAIGLLAGLAAVPLGLLMAVLLIHVINRRAFGWSMDMTVVPADLVNAVLLATTAALVAGLYPAWRAGRRSPALAMRED